MTECLFNYMAESDNYLRLLRNAHSNPQIKKIIEDVEKFHSYANSMGIPTERKAILRSREEMKFESVNSNWH